MSTTEIRSRPAVYVAKCRHIRIKSSLRHQESNADGDRLDYDRAAWTVVTRSPSQKTRTNPLADTATATIPSRLEMEAAATCLLPRPSGTSTPSARTSK
jgi:hypothetical protein